MKLYRKYRQWRGYGFGRKNSLLLAVKYLNL